MKLGLMRWGDIPSDMPYIEKDDDPKSPGLIYKKGRGLEDSRKDLDILHGEDVAVERVYLYTRTKTHRMKMPIKLGRHLGKEGEDKEFRVIAEDTLEAFKQGLKKYKG